MKDKIHINQTTIIRNDYLRDIVSKLVEQRNKLKLTQEELNSRLGVADRLVSKWECGLRTPTSFHLYCWAFALGLRLSVSANDNIPPENNPSKNKASNDNRFTIVPK